MIFILGKRHDSLNGDHPVITLRVKEAKVLAAELLRIAEETEDHLTENEITIQSDYFPAWIKLQVITND